MCNAGHLANGPQAVLCNCRAPLRKGMSSSRVRSIPSAAAIVESLLIELSRTCWFSSLSSSMSTATGYSEDPSPSACAGHSRKKHGKTFRSRHQATSRNGAGEVGACRHRAGVADTMVAPSDEEPGGCQGATVTPWAAMLLHM